MLKLPVHHRTDDNKLQHVQDLDFSEVGTKHKIVADTEKIIWVEHTLVTGNPHPRFLLFPEGSTTTFELRDDGNIYITCDTAFKCEAQHSHRGPYEVFECQPNIALLISGQKNLFATFSFRDIEL